MFLVTYACSRSIWYRNNIIIFVIKYQGVINTSCQVIFCMKYGSPEIFLLNNFSNYLQSAFSIKKSIKIYRYYVIMTNLSWFETLCGYVVEYVFPLVESVRPFLLPLLILYCEYEVVSVMLLICNDSSELVILVLSLLCNRVAVI